MPFYLGGCDKTQLLEEGNIDMTEKDLANPVVSASLSAKGNDWDYYQVDHLPKEPSHAVNKFVAKHPQIIVNHSPGTSLFKYGAKGQSLDHNYGSSTSHQNVGLEDLNQKLNSIFGHKL